MQFPDDDIRVIFINSYSNIARIILCEVSIGLLIIVLYRTKPRHLYLSWQALRSHGISGYPRYVWITYAWYQDQWWTSGVNNEPIRCSEDELVQLLRLSLAIEIVPVPDDPSAQTDVGLVRWIHTIAWTDFILILPTCAYMYRQQMNFQTNMPDDSTPQLLKATTIHSLLWLLLLMMQSGLLRWPWIVAGQCLDGWGMQS